jgi:hypothetical protein
VIAPKTASRVRGVVILYATIAVGMLGVLGSTMSDGSQATVDAVQASVFNQLARYAAESGIEVGIAALNAHLAMDQPRPEPVAGGTFTFLNTPNRTPMADSTQFDPCVFSNGAFTIAWAGGGTENRCANGTGKGLLKLHPPGWDVPNPGVTTSGPEADRERIAQRYVASFQLSMSPAFTRFNVFKRLNNDMDAVFALRSRGMIRGGADPDNAGSLMLIGHAILVAKIRVGGQPCNRNHGRIERISMDLVPAYDRPGPAYPPPGPGTIAGHAAESGSVLPAVSLPH